MENQWKQDFDRFIENLCSEISLKELMSELIKNVPAGIPGIGDYFSSALSSHENAVQMRALFRIFQLSKEYKDAIARMRDKINGMKELHKIEIERIEEIIHLLERKGRQYEREKFPYQIFHFHQFDEVKTLLRFNPVDIKSHIERNVEKSELDDSAILVGKIGAGKTTSLVKIVERLKPNLIVVVKDDVRTERLEKLYGIENLGECVVIWDDIQDSINEFLRALPIIRKLKNIKFIGAIRSTDYKELGKDRYFGETRFKKLEIEEFSQEEVKKLIELLENEFEKPLKDLKPLLVKKIEEADGTPFYITSVFLDPQPFTAEFIEDLPKNVQEIWSRYFMYLDSNERCVMKTLKMIKKHLGVPEEEFVRDVYNKTFHGDLNEFSISLKNLVEKKWVSTVYSKLWESRIIISKDAQILCFEIDNLEMKDFYKCLYEENLEPKLHHAGILCSVAYSFLKEEDYEKSEQFLNKAIELDPKIAFAYEVRGNLYFTLEEFDQAISNFGEAIKLYPEYAEAYNNRGFAYFKLRRLNEAVGEYSIAIELDPKLAKAYGNRGLAYCELKQLGKAMRDCDKAIELDPKLAEAYNNRGLVYYELEQFNEAIKDYDKAIELDQKITRAYYNRANAYYKLRRFEEAMRDCDKAIELDPEYAEAYNNRGAYYDELKQFEKAMEDFDEAIRLNPRLAEAYINRAGVYFKLKQFNKAIQECNKAIELDSKHLAGYANREDVHCEWKQFDDALKDHNGIVRPDSKIAAAYKIRGLGYFGLMEFDKALYDLSKAVKLDPGIAESYLYRGRVYYELKQLNKAIRDYNKVIELDPELALAYYNRGSIYCELKQFEKAMEDFDEAIRLDPRLAEAYINRAGVYYELKKFEEAQDNYSKATKIIFEKRVQEDTQTPFRQIFDNLENFDSEFRIKNGIYAAAIDYLRDFFDLRLLRRIWTYRFSLDKSPEKIILYFLGGMFGFGEDIFSLRNSIEDERYLEILSEIFESMKEGRISQELERSITEMEENTAIWNLLLLCLKKLLQCKDPDRNTN